MKVIGEPDRGKPYVRFDEGVLAVRVWRTYTGTKPETADTAKGSLQLGLPGSTLPILQGEYSWLRSGAMAL